jgi:hypothetical protein
MLCHICECLGLSGVLERSLDFRLSLTNLSQSVSNLDRVLVTIAGRVTNICETFSNPAKRFSKICRSLDIPTRMLGMI